MSAAGIDLVKRFEGLSLSPYRDVAGHWTVGFGHLVPGTDSPEAISEAEAERLLALDLTRAEQAVLRHVEVPLTQGEFDALTSFVFNLGGERFARSTLRRKLNAGDRLGVPAELLRWHHAGGKALKGLLRRRLAEATLFLSD